MIVSGGEAAALVAKAEKMDRKKNTKKFAGKGMDTGDEKKFAKKRKSPEGGADPKKGGGEKKQRAYENIVTPDGKPDWKKMRLERKRLKETRKKKDMKPEIYELTKEAKVIWESLRREDCPPNVREKLCEEMHQLVNGHIKRLAFAHDTARVLESLLLYGTEAIRKNIHVAFSAKEDIMFLMKSKYGHFLAQKLMKYASKEQRDAIFKSIESHIVTLLKHQYASRVLNEFYTTYAKASQKATIIKECYAPLLRLEVELGSDLKLVLQKFPEKKDTILKDLEELITFMLEKDLKTNTILHLLMHEYLENCPHAERTELITTMREELVNILHTNEGSLLGMSCLWHGAPKDRKVIVKSFKGFIPKIACDKHGYRVLLAVIDTVDDVVLISKAICNEMLLNINELVLNQYGQRTIVYLLEHRSSLFFDPEIVKLLAQGDSNEYTKKPIDQRLLNVTEPLEQEFVDGIIDNFGMWIKENTACLVAKFILKRFSGCRLNDAVEKIAESIVELATAEGVERTAVEGLSKFILCELPMETRVAFSMAVINNLKKLEMVKLWLQINRGCFTLRRIWEKCGDDSIPGEEVKKMVKSNLAAIKKHPTAGGKLLKDIVDN